MTTAPQQNLNQIALAEACDRLYATNYPVPTVREDEVWAYTEHHNFLIRKRHERYRVEVFPQAKASKIYYTPTYDASKNVAVPSWIVRQLTNALPGPAPSHRAWGVLDKDNVVELVLFPTAPVTLLPKMRAVVLRSRCNSPFTSRLFTSSKDWHTWSIETFWRLVIDGKLIHLAKRRYPQDFKQAFGPVKSRAIILWNGNIFAPPVTWREILKVTAHPAFKVGPPLLFR